MSQLQVKFCQYHKDNPEVYTEFEKFALKTINKGFTHYSAKGIFELIRWHTGVAAKGAYKVNNNYTPFYARMFEESHPEHDGFFRKRKSKFDI